MAGRIKMTIGQNGSIKTDMSGFKSCAERTKEMLASLDVEASEITIKDKEEDVQTVSTAKQRVNR